MLCRHLVRQDYVNLTHTTLCKGLYPGLQPSQRDTQPLPQHKPCVEVTAVCVCVTTVPYQQTSTTSHQNERGNQGCWISEVEVFCMLDKLRPTTYLHGFCVWLRCLTSLLQKVPRWWKTGVIIRKISKPANPSDFRPKSITSIFSLPCTDASFAVFHPLAG